MELLESVGGTEVIKFPTKKIKYCKLDYRHSLLEIWCYSLQKGETRDLLKIDIQEVKEIRYGKKIKDFDSLPRGFTEEDFHFFTIHYGNEFRLKTLSLAVKQNDHAEKWIECLEVVSRGLEFPYKCRKDAWLTREFSSVAQNGFLTSGGLKSLMNNLSVNVEVEELKKELRKRNLECEQIPLATFLTLIKEFEHDIKIFDTCFGGYNRDGRVYTDHFKSFVECEQGENNSSLYEGLLFECHNSSPCNNHSVGSYEALDFLFSKENEVWKPECSSVYQDMTHPLSHYWISCSHNTFLTGDQVTSESSVEAYVRCLKQGCRSIEVDCWDGPEGFPFPLVYHGLNGLTLTTKIKFSDVIQAIKDYGFTTSEYPIIISIENHCGIKQQKLMAQTMREVFGEMLISEPCTHNETNVFPSPEQLKRKILVKGKAKPKCRVGAIEADSFDDCSLNGELYLQTLEASDCSDPFSTGFSFNIDVNDMETANNTDAILNRDNNSTDNGGFIRSDGHPEVAEELSKLSWIKSVKKGINNNDQRNQIFNHMTSLSEHFAVKDMRMNPSRYILYHQIQFSRVYPTGIRFNSSNYDPTPFWNAGCQMVSLNYQKPDKALQINRGKFLDNGRCGYILKPSYHLDAKKHADIPQTVTDFIGKNNKLYMQITIIAARHLHQFWKGFIRPFVQLEFFGAEIDKPEIDNYKKRTKSVDNGLNPFWNQEFSCKIICPELALIRFSIKSEGAIGDRPLIGQATYPVCCLRSGFRSVPLRNGYGEEILSVLLIKCEPRRREYL